MNFQLAYPFLVLFFLLLAVFKWRKPNLNPLKSTGFWVLFLLLSLLLYAAIIFMVLYAIGGGRATHNP